MLSTRNYILDSVGRIPENMVHIPGIRISINNSLLKNVESAEIKDFLIDKYEVTNKQYKVFVESGGYQNKNYWDQPFIKSGRNLTWEEAMSFFLDKTGRSGPSTWVAGDYPKDEDNYPVGGVSWYEAAAYAEFMHKSLPTFYHWRRAAGLDYRSYLPRLILSGDGVWGISFVILKSNFNAKGPSPVGYYKGMTSYGTSDMVGNVREWNWNESTPGDQRFIVGGGWNDPTYMSSDEYFQDPFDRSQINGFRCVKYLHSDENLTILQSPIEKRKTRDFMHEKPASDQQFEIFKRMYVYDKSDLNSIIESEDSSETYWIKQKITFNAPYGNERVITYLFLPKNYNPPYQTVVYFPGSSALNMLSSKSLVGMMNIDYILKSGRAVIYGNLRKKI
jgi:formylglycine-generating enzyme required for sulfatase activity